MGSDDDELEKRPDAEDERPVDAEPWAKTSSGDADSITPDDDE